MPRQIRFLLVLVAFLFSISPSRASTAAFAGKVIKVEPAAPNDKDGLRRFTVEIGFFEYISWNKFGPHSKVGETITRRVKKIGTCCMINGRLVNAETLANAIKPGQWGYFYEDTWLDLYTTPDFQWGEVIEHNPTKKQFKLRVWLTPSDRPYHLKTNPPRDSVVTYDNDTAFQIEEKKSDAKSALTVGNWVQIHQPRTEIFLLRSKASDFDPGELLPHDKGRRGFANDLCAPAILKSVKTKDPKRVCDLAATVAVSVKRDGKWTEETINCNKTSFIMDGKSCPVGIAARPGRHLVLGYYRSEKRPHKIFVRSIKDTIHGTVSSTKRDGAVEITWDENGKVSQTRVRPDKTAKFWLNGVQAERQAIRDGMEIIVNPARGRTVIAFPPQQ